MGYKLKDFPEHVQEKIRAQLASEITVVERNFRNALEAKNGVQKSPAWFSAPVRITVHCFRKRLVDLENIMSKYVTDEIVNQRILENDDPAHVQEIIFKQEKSKENRTDIIIEEI